MCETFVNLERNLTCRMPATQNLSIKTAAKKFN